MSEPTTRTYHVVGMTCGHCASAVTNEISALPGVHEVSVELVTGATSSVTVISDAPLPEADVATALDEAGDYRLAHR